MKTFVALVLSTLVVVAVSGPAISDEKVQHYEAKPAETLEQAVENFSEYNKRLSKVLQKKSLTTSDLEKIHELTYTLEVALAKINEELSGLPATLETLHLASEKHNEAQARGVGKVYMEIATTVVP